MGGSSGGGGAVSEGSDPHGMAQTPLDLFILNVINTIKNLTNNTQNPDLYKWRMITFVKTDRNG